MVVWQWGNFSITVFSLTFLTAVVVGLAMVIAEGRSKLLPEQRVIDFIIISLVAGITGGRLTYVLLFNLDYYLDNPLHLIRLQDGGLSFWGAIAAVLVVVSVWTVRNNISMERYLDAAAPALAAGLSLGFSGVVLQGKPMLSPYPWGIVSGGLLHHPDGVYTIILLVVLLYIIRTRRSRIVYEGELFVWFLLGYGLINLGVDLFRVTHPVVWILSPGQAASLAAVLFAFIYILAGTKIYTAARYTGRKVYTGVSRTASFLRLARYIFFGAALVVLYYWTHGYFIFSL